MRVDGSVTAPVEAGQTLGTLTITSGGQTIAERDLIAPEAVGALRWGDVYSADAPRALYGVSLCHRPLAHFA